MYESLDAVSHLPFSDELDESLALELPDVVVHLLPGHPDPARETGGRFGLFEFAEYLQPNRMKSGCRHSALVDDINGGSHAYSRSPGGEGLHPKNLDK